MSSQPAPEVEALLGTGVADSTAAWQRVKAYLSESFAAYLGQPAAPMWEPVYEDIGPRGALSFGLRSAAPIGGPLGLEWYAMVSHNGGHTMAVVLLFAGDRRLTPVDGSEYLRFELGRSADGQWGWNGRGWEASELGEWDGYQSLVEVDQRMRAAAGTGE